MKINTLKDLHISLYSLIDFFIVVLAIINIFIELSFEHSLIITGYFVIFTSVYTILKSKDSKNLMILFVFLGFINISMAYTDCIMLGSTVSEWQLLGLRSDSINVEVAKSVFLCIATLNAFITPNRTPDKIMNISERKTNKVIAYSGTVLLYLILIHSILFVNIGFAQYESVANPLYEYSIIVLVFSWMYSKNLKSIRHLHFIFVFLFAIRFGLIGDRSSVFMLFMAMLLMYYGDRLKFREIVSLIFFGVPVVNFVALYRSYGFLPHKEIISIILERGFYVDTISWAYYSGLSIASLHNYVDEPIDLLIGYFFRIFGISNDYQNLAEYARNFSSLYNNGGGFYSSYFYAFGGYSGVFLGSLVLAILIRNIFYSKNSLLYPYSIIIVVYCLRWYLYDPTTLFRGCLLFTTCVYFICYHVHGLCIKKYM